MNVNNNWVQNSAKIFEMFEKEFVISKKNVLPSQNDNKINRKVNGTTYHIFFICCQSYFFLV